MGEEGEGEEDMEYVECGVEEAKIARPAKDPKAPTRAEVEAHEAEAVADEAAVAAEEALGVAADDLAGRRRR